MTEASLQKAAILMLALGQNEAAEALKYLDHHEIEKLGVAMSAMKSVSSEDLELVLKEFHEDSITQTLFGIDSENYIRHVLTKALGEAKGTNLLNRIQINRDVSGIEYLKHMESKAVAQLIAQEHPQIIVVIMVHLEPMQASEVLMKLPENLRTEVLLRITNIDIVQPIALSELNDSLSELLIGNNILKAMPIDGIRSTASIINCLGNGIESGLLSKLTEINADVTEKIKTQLFNFEDITNLNDKDIQQILQSISTESLIVALKGAREELKDKFFHNMTERAAEMLSDNIQAQGPVKLKDIDRQQKEILQTIRHLADGDKINIHPDSESYFV